MIGKYIVNKYYSYKFKKEINRLNSNLNALEDEAKKKYGDSVVDAALELAKSKGKIIKFINDQDPYEAMVKWYQEETAEGFEINDQMFNDWQKNT